MEPVFALGLMSGTSLDGIDAALIRTDGVKVESFGPWMSQPYDDTMRARLRAALLSAAKLGAGARHVPEIAALTQDMTRLHGEVVGTILARAGIDRTQIAVIGFHGQTLWHQPQNRLTLQIGDGEWLARNLAIDVVYDFRSNDVAAGGQGAPLVPLYHQGLARDLDGGVGCDKGPLAILNIGGVANVTWLDLRLDPMREGILAFDTGPGNGLIDDWCVRHIGAAMDQDGRLAAQGRVDGAILNALMRAPYLSASPPKSLDRLAFDLALADSLSPADGAATLTAFTATTVRAAIAHMPERPVRWIVCGGGRHNPVLMQMLRDQLGSDVATAEQAGWRGDALEAEAFAFLAVRHLRNLPLSLPTTTGAPVPLAGGVLARSA